MPTLDAGSIVTATPAAAAQCPQVNADLVPDFQIPDWFSCFNGGGTNEECFPPGMEEKFLDFLNRGGSPNELLQLRNIRQSFYQDVTGDGLPELMLFDLGVISRPHIYYCKAGRFEMYTFATENDPGYYMRFYEIQDLNADNIPEILFTFADCSGSGCSGISALEWDGHTFQNLSPTIGAWGALYLHIQDGKNGTKEIVQAGDRPGTCCYDTWAPWRLRIDTYAWDGKQFSLAYETFSPAQYRYQAAQDADREVLYGNYAKAMQLYRNVIFSDKLQWWSAERRADLLKNHFWELDPTYFAINVRSSQLPPDLTEYPRLAAYAYYRIMLLQTVEGKQADARATYATLQQDFGDNQYGRPYVEMATAFWDAYQATSKMYDGCAAAIGYAAQHPEILEPLYGGSSQDRQYEPADVCPFR